MRIATQNFYDRSLFNLQTRQTDLDRAQEELATGKKILRPSDDPVGANSIIRFKKELEVSDRYIDAQTSASRFNHEVETSLSSMNNILLRVQEILTGAINGALDSESLLAYKEEISSRMQEYEGIANQKNANGDFMFAGYQTQTKPYEKDDFGYHQYFGDDGQREVLIAPSFKVPVADPGSTFISNVASNYSHFKPSAAGASGAEVSMGFADDIQEINMPTAPLNTFQIQFSGATPPVADTWQVVDLSMPAPNLVGGPYDYTAGDDIQFQGLTVKTDVNNPPQAADSFDMQPTTNAQETSVFWVMQQAMDALDIIGANYTGKSISNSSITVNGGNIVFPDDHKLADYDIVFPAAGSVEVREVDRTTTPATILSTPIPAQLYNPAGTSLEFNGVKIDLAGTAGNQTTVPAAPAPNYPETVKLDRPENARRADVLGSLLNEVSNAQTSIDNIRSQIGARLNSIDNQEQAQLLFKETTRTSLAQIEEIDIYEAVTNLETSKVGLQSAQQAFARIQNLTLFDYI